MIDVGYRDPDDVELLEGEDHRRPSRAEIEPPTDREVAMASGPGAVARREAEIGKLLAALERGRVEWARSRTLWDELEGA